MSETATTATQRRQNTRQGLLARLIGLPFQLFGVLVGSLPLSSIVECACMHFIWKDQGLHHAQAMLHYVHPLVILLPSAALLGLAVNLTTANL